MATLLTPSCSMPVCLVAVKIVAKATPAVPFSIGEYGGSKEPFNRFYSFSGTQSSDYPHKWIFGFQSVLGNTLEQLDILQGLSLTNLSKRLPSYLVAFRRSWTHKMTKATPELDRSIVQILRLLVPLIVPLIDWQQTFRCGLILFTPSRYQEDAINIVAVVAATETRPRPIAGISRATASLRFMMQQKSCCGRVHYWLLIARAAKSTV
jgi:hypothetical protein